MTLKEELEILRGEPIEVFTGDPMDIPCIETSDPDKLCKHPVVSVSMITYNHEPYIRQAIEGVMMQKTDFEFELVIGEDASTDKTREICFEYQKRYPDKIRVLWWHENVSKLGGNGRRCRAHCRGEFIALCEGDDYWIDPLKLQKQVDVLRKHPDVAFCFCGARVFTESTGKTSCWNEDGSWEAGLVAGREFMLKNLFGLYPSGSLMSSATFIMTATVMFRVSMRDRARKLFDVFSWRLHIGDSTLWLGLASVGNAYFLDDVVAVYNLRRSGLTMSCPVKVIMDTYVVKLYFFLKAVGRDISELPFRYYEVVASSLLFQRLAVLSRQKQRCVLRALDATRIGRGILRRPFLFSVFVLSYLIGVRRCWCQWVRRYFAYFGDPNVAPQWLKDEYVAFGNPLKDPEGALMDKCRRIVVYLRRLIGSV